MPTLAPGSERGRQRGFTLLELMVVVAMMAIMTAVVSFAIPDPSSTRLEREAARLIALLEAARTQARSGALTVLWLPQSSGPEGDYRFIGLPDAFMPPLKWQAPDVHAEVVGARSIVLGPEPVIGPQSVILHLEDKQIIISTDGLAPFDVLNAMAEGDAAIPAGGPRAATP